MGKIRGGDFLGNGRGDLGKNRGTVFGKKTEKGLFGEDFRGGFFNVKKFLSADRYWLLHYQSVIQVHDSAEIFPIAHIGEGGFPCVL